MTIKGTNAERICAYSMRRGKMKNESGVSAFDGETTRDALTVERTNTATTSSRDEQMNAHPHGAGDCTRAPEAKALKGGAAMNDNDDKLLGSAPVLGKALGVALETRPKKTVQVDVQKYQAYLDDPDLTDAQKEQIVEALWSIILAFVDLGFGVSPLQDACGQLSEIHDEGGEADSDLLSSHPDTLTETFNNCAAE